jgi:RNA polymerase sigma-70 factor (ECF subfamily)
MPEGTEVARQLLAGGREAWAKFEREYRLVVLKAVHSTARKFGASPVDVEDAASQVFLELLENDGRVLRSFRGTSAFTTWLTVIAYRVAAREFSRRVRTRQVEASGPVRESAPPPPDGEVLEFLEKLPESDRRALVLFHIEGASYREISASLGVPSNQVGMVLLRAREKLGRLISGRSGDSGYIPDPASHG